MNPHPQKSFTVTKNKKELIFQFSHDVPTKEFVILFQETTQEKFQGGLSVPSPISENNLKIPLCYLKEIVCFYAII